MPPEGFVAGSRYKFALDLTSGEPPPPPRFFGIIGLEENLILNPRAATRCGENLEKERVSGFRFRVPRFQSFQGFKDPCPVTFAELGSNPTLQTALRLGRSSPSSSERAAFTAFGFQRSFIAWRNSGSLSSGTFFRPRQSPHRTLGPWRLATLVANVLSQESSAVSVR
jgi:hypothetical protein